MAEWSTVGIAELGHAQRIEAEYYRPRYLETAARLEAAQSAPLTRYLAYLTDGTHVTPKYVPQGVPFLSSSDIDPFVVSHAIAKFISEAEHSRLRHCQPDAGDILMSKSGRIGSCAVVPSSITKGDWNIYEGVALLRIEGIDPHYAVAFLNSKYGYRQIRRELKGVAQPHLHLEDIRRLRIFVPSTDEMVEVSAIDADGVERSQRSHALYLQAQQLLESELGLDSVTFQKPVGYTARFRELELTRRFDSEHYYPAFDSLRERLPGHVQWARLGELLNFCQRGKQPIYSEGGLPVLNSKHILQNAITLEGNRCAKSGPTSLQIQYGDVLINGTGRGTIGRAAPYLVSEHNAIPDNHVTILRSPNRDPAFLSIFLNSLAGKLQVEKHQRGSSGQLELYPLDLKKFWIWDAPQSIQAEVRCLFDRATECAETSKKLLEKAKARVEQLIEKAAQP